jgi:phage terminase Nu1 subunit (DNA packaging protein)
MQAGGSRGFSSDRTRFWVTPEKAFWAKDLAMSRPDGSPSDTDLAAALGLSLSGFKKARRDGRISFSRDVNVLRREFTQNTDSRMQRSKTHPRHKTATGDLTASRARYELARAKEKELKLRQMEGELVDRAKAAAMYFEMGKRTREMWEQWPSRVAAMLTAELKSDLHTVEQALTKHVKEHLRQIPQDLRAQFR